MAIKVNSKTVLSNGVKMDKKLLKEKKELTEIRLIKDGEWERLLPEYTHSFKSVFGPQKSISNGMLFMTYKNFDPRNLRKELSHDEYRRVKKGPKKQVPNYWNLITFMIVDRLMSDRELLQDLNERFKGVNPTTIRVYPYVVTQAGLAKQTIYNDRLKTYGIITSKVIGKTLSIFRSIAGEEVNFLNLEKEKFHELKMFVKKEIWDMVSENIKGEKGLLMDGVDDSVSNEEVEKAFMK